MDFGEKYYECKSINANLQEDAFICELDQELKAQTPAGMLQVNSTFLSLNFTHVTICTLQRVGNVHISIVISSGIGMVVVGGRGFLLKGPCMHCHTGAAHLYSNAADN